ncbi:hypothetical protein NUW54_g6333 [Trametes sanguinea]|uniref:Uncharacterized protein n=1 Tax=Trametes sanguinea TaxID=158606 RepID=A0ACC1PVW7_9APHY|nr:hypothetical protein NUW54_g6333 [Trametes sanguinea]
MTAHRTTSMGRQVARPMMPSDIGSVQAERRCFCNGRIRTASLPQTPTTARAGSDSEAFDIALGQWYSIGFERAGVPIDHVAMELVRHLEARRRSAWISSLFRGSRSLLGLSGPADRYSGEARAELAHSMPHNHPTVRGHGIATYYDKSEWGPNPKGANAEPVARTHNVRRHRGIGGYEALWSSGVVETEGADGGWPEGRDGRMVEAGLCRSVPQRRSAPRNVGVNPPHLDALVVTHEASELRFRKSLEKLLSLA